MDCPYYNLDNYRCKITGEYVYDNIKHDYYCFNGSCGYENCPVYKDYWERR